MSTQPCSASPWVRAASGTMLAGLAALMVWDPQPATYIGGCLFAAVLIGLAAVARIIDGNAKGDA